MFVTVTNKEQIVAKKLPPMKKVATPRKKAATPKAEDKAAAPPVPAKKHERHSKPSEKERIERGKQLAAAYLMQRDGMDSDTAIMVVESMDPDTINELNTEAATAVLEKSKEAATAAPSAPATSPVDAGGTSAEQEAGEEAIPAVDFTTVPALAEDDTFPEIAIRCRDAAVTKNEAETRYKTDKKLLDSILKEAGINKNAPVQVADVKLTRYTGYTPYLSETLLLEKGVSPDVIKACWVKKPYDDVRVFTPKAK